MRLISAPGSLRGLVVEVDGWRHVGGELRVRCRTTDGARVLLPAAWTDLPLNGTNKAPVNEDLIATPEGWRRFATIAVGVRGRRPPGAEGCLRNGGGGDAGSAGIDGERESMVPAAVWETLPGEVRTRVTVMLAQLLAAMIEQARDE